MITNFDIFFQISIKEHDWPFYINHGNSLGFVMFNSIMLLLVRID